MPQLEFKLKIKRNCEFPDCHNKATYVCHPDNPEATYYLCSQHQGLFHGDGNTPQLIKNGGRK